MDFILGILGAGTWFGAGMFFMSVVSINRNKELQQEKYNAEERAVTHFRKLQKIENILRKDIINKTPAVLTVEKIKEALVNECESDN